jgi:hypothetical protein
MLATCLIGLMNSYAIDVDVESSARIRTADNQAAAGAIPGAGDMSDAAARTTRRSIRRQPSTVSRTACGPRRSRTRFAYYSCRLT